jgi:hypothetical protein
MRFIRMHTDIELLVGNSAATCLMVAAPFSGPSLRDGGQQSPLPETNTA